MDALPAHILNVKCMHDIEHIIFFFLQDPVLVLNLSSNGHVSSFWMVNQQSKRFVVSSLILSVGLVHTTILV